MLESLIFQIITYVRFVIDFDVEVAKTNESLSSRVGHLRRNFLRFRVEWKERMHSSKLKFLFKLNICQNYSLALNN